MYHSIYGAVDSALQTAGGGVEEKAADAERDEGTPAAKDGSTRGIVEKKRAAAAGPAGQDSATATGLTPAGAGGSPSDTGNGPNNRPLAPSAPPAAKGGLAIVSVGAVAPTGSQEQAGSKDRAGGSKEKAERPEQPATKDKTQLAKDRVVAALLSRGAGGKNEKLPTASSVPDSQLSALPPLLPGAVAAVGACAGGSGGGKARPTPAAHQGAPQHHGGGNRPVSGAAQPSPPRGPAPSSPAATSTSTRALRNVTFLPHIKVAAPWISRHFDQWGKPVFTLHLRGGATVRVRRGKIG